MPSRNDPPNQPESQPPDLFSSVETRAMLEEFRELVRAGILRVTPENEVLPVTPQHPGSAERQPDTSASREEEVALLDKQLIDWLERRREQKADQPRRREAVRPGAPIDTVAASIRQKVIDRVSQKVIESWERLDRGADPRSSLREQIMDKIADEVLRRMQRE